MPLINFSGIASGIDTNSLIQAILDADRKTKIDPLDAKVIRLDDQTKKLNELKKLMVELKDIGTDMRAVNGGAVSKTATSSDETVATVSATNAASNTSVSINVSTIASNSTASFNNTFAATSTVINSGASASTVSFTIGTGSNQEIVSVDVDNTTTVAQFVTEFNENSTKAVATAVNVGTSSSPSYKIVVTTLNEGIEKGDIGSITDSSSFFSSGSTITHATNASFSVSGITGSITRASNTVSDVIEGVTIQLLKGGSVSTTIAVKDDVEGTKSTIQEFIDKYNEIVAFVKENNLVAPPADDPNGLNVFGPLANTSTDDNALSALRTAISATQYSAGTSVKILADLGIKTNQDGTLELKSTTDISLEKAIGAESDSVKQLLANLGDKLGALASAGGVIDNFTRFGGIFQQSTDANSERITELNRRITDAESALTKKEQSLLAQFARLESLMGNLQAQQSQLTSALAGLAGIGG